MLEAEAAQPSAQPTDESVVRAARHRRLRRGGHCDSGLRLSSAPLATLACQPCVDATEEGAEPTAYEELACCNVCNEGDWEDENQIIFCDSCDLAVHQVGHARAPMRSVCYGAGAREIPAGDQPWFCDMCRFCRRSTNSNRRIQPDCILCPEKGGAMKRTTDSRWAHLT
eukprot:scaffold84684_cov32-Tisochrysis_lutea.AAC.2